MKIKFHDLKRLHLRMKNEINSEIKSILMSGEEDPDLSPYVEEFENSFAKYCNVKYAIGVNCGTAALQFSLIASGVGEGDEVITTSNTYIATALAISNIGAKPVFVEIDENNHNVDVSKIEKKISDKTKAIIPVHLYGHVCDMDAITDIAKKNNLKVIEDACQAHGAEYKGRKVGSIGDIGCFSFYTTKNLGGFGNGGLVVTDDKEIIDKIRILRDPESNDEFLIQSKRTPCYLDAIQAAFLKVRLNHLDNLNELRRRNASLYNELLKDSKIVLPKEENYGKHIFHSYVIRSKDRNKLRDYLAKKRVGSFIEYEPLIHLSKTYSYLGYKEGDLPVTERVNKEILSLPIFPYLKEIEIRKIASLVKNFMSEKS